MAAVIGGAVTIISTFPVQAAPNKRVSTTFDQSAYRWFENKNNIGTAFDADGVINGAAASNTALATTSDGTYMYVAGYDDNNNWRIEKRRLDTGALCTATACGTAFDADGVINGAAASGVALAITSDGTYMYVAGYDDSFNWRIEKRRLDTGALCTAAACGTAFSTDGVVNGATASSGAATITTDGTYMYVAGSNDSFNWRIEKRLLTTGALDTNFDGDGIIDGVAASESVADIATDGTYLYASGTGGLGPNMRIEKRLLTTGALDTNFDGDGVVVGAPESDGSNAITTDATYMYIAGENNSNNWRIEKRLLTTGALDTTFDSDGIIDDVAESRNISDIINDNTYMYIVGENDSNNWRIEKRLLTTGALENSFDGDGVVDGVAASNIAHSVTADGTSLYAAGSNDSNNWRIEKRLLTTGAPTTNSETALPLAAPNTAAVAPSQGTPFRLRMNIHIGAKELVQSGQSFKLQFAGKGAGTCSAPSGISSSYIDVTASTAIRYYDNSLISDNTAFTANADDPTHGSDILKPQTYEEANNFTNSASAININEDGMWDFALVDSTASSGTTYCFRAVKADGTVLDTYTQYAEIVTS